MSKMDDMRAMREARYAAAQPRAAKPAVKPRTPQVVATTPEPQGDELCGHRNMSGRTCTREKGHEARSHRYS